MSWTPVSRDRRARLESLTLSFTDAQVKEWPTLSGAIRELIPAQGAHRIILPVQLLLIVRKAVVYTNVNAGVQAYFTIGDNAAASDSVDQAHFIFDADTVDLFVPLTVNYGITEDVLSNYANQPLNLKIDNQGSGAFTGGDDDNEIIADLTYKILTVRS